MEYYFFFCPTLLLVAKNLLTYTIAQACLNPQTLSYRLPRIGMTIMEQQDKFSLLSFVLIILKKGLKYNLNIYAFPLFPFNSSIYPSPQYLKFMASFFISCFHVHTNTYVHVYTHTHIYSCMCINITC